MTGLCMAPMEIFFDVLRRRVGQPRRPVVRKHYTSVVVCFGERVQWTSVETRGTNHVEYLPNGEDIDCLYTLDDV